MAPAIRSRKAPDLWAILQVLLFAAPLVGGYVALNREIATLQAQVDSLQRNAQGLEQYVMDLYRQGRTP